MAKKKLQFSTKVEYEVLIVIPSAGLTMRIDSYTDRETAQVEARRLHRIDKQPYKVIKVTKECIFKVSGDL